MTGARRNRAPRISRDCTHSQVHHEHGTVDAYKQDRCRCTPCTEGAADWERRRRLDAFIGAPPRVLDSTEVRAHLAELQAAGIGYKRVAVLAGVTSTTVARLIRQPNPQRRVRPEVAERILAVTATLDAASPGAVVDATGMVRRLQALHVMGWSRRELSDRLGVYHNALAAAHRTGHASARLVRAVRALHDELWDQAPPTDTWRERASATRVRAWATDQGWAPSMAWDDETIDDPQARPRGMRTIQWDAAA